MHIDSNRICFLFDHFFYIPYFFHCHCLTKVCKVKDFPWHFSWSNDSLTVFCCFLCPYDSLKLKLSFLLHSPCLLGCRNLNIRIYILRQLKGTFARIRLHCLTGSDSPGDQKRPFTDLIDIELRFVSVSQQFHPCRGSLLTPVLVAHQSEILSF